MNLETVLQTKIHVLSEEQQRRVLDFVEGLTDDEDKPSIWRKLEQRLEQVPPDEIAELPTDASENLKHYLYGSTKKHK
jgi:hypothetical protein